MHNLLDHVGLDSAGGGGGGPIQNAVAADVAPARSRDRELDQFYTRPDVAAACMAHVMKITGGKASTWLEPSAGTGSFLDLLPQPRIGLDLDHTGHPEVKGGINFLKWQDGTALQKPVVTVGNPPFGRNASLALKFVKHAMIFSEFVCMILPRTFEKEAMKLKVDDTFELVHSEVLEPFSFIHEGKPYDVPCCFQIWRKTENKRRATERPLEHSDFDYVDNPDEAKFAFQRVGARAGLVSTEGLAKSWKSHYFIRPNCDPDILMERLRSIDWSGVRESTAGNPSIGKGELVAIYTEKFGPSVWNRPQSSFEF